VLCYTLTIAIVCNHRITDGWRARLIERLQRPRAADDFVVDNGLG
jgi:hypothetical protein